MLTLGWQTAPMGMFTAMWRFFNFAPIISLESVKLGTSIVTCKLIQRYTNARITDYPWKGCDHGHVTSLNFENKWSYLRIGAKKRRGCNESLIRNRMWPIEWHHCQFQWMTLKVTFAVSNLSNSDTLWNIAWIY